MRLLCRRILPLLAATVTWIASSPLAAQLPSGSSSSPALASRLVVAAARTASQSVAVGRTQRAATVRGVVRDSIAGQPLRNAQVQLVSADTLTPFGETIASDSVGAFVFPAVPKGRYLISFFHPLLDSLGIEASPRVVIVGDDRSVLADLAMPSLAELRGMLCRNAAAGSASGGIAMGFVRDAQHLAPMSGVAVNTEWIELSIGTSGLQRRTSRRATTTDANGRYVFCDVPSPGTLVLMASNGTDSTDLVEAAVSGSGALRRALYLGSARVPLGSASAPSITVASDSTTAPVNRSRVGNGQLSGRVVTADGTRPLAGAQVGVPNGPQTRTNERGEWTLSGVPTGTRSLETRAVGFYPVRQTVDVIDGAPPVLSALATLKSVLDTMKVSANYDRFTQLAGFRERRRSGAGRYLTGIEVARHAPIVTSDLFRSMPSVYVEWSDVGGSSDPLGWTILMRDAFSAGRCVPRIFWNDVMLPRSITASEIDAMVHPGDIVGIEVYASSAVPAQFQQGLGGCGSIVFWTK